PINMADAWNEAVICGKPLLLGSQFLLILLTWENQCLGPKVRNGEKSSQGKEDSEGIWVALGSGLVNLY
ncbi:hypothetical protein STEG23_033676, partial [Scotinomys teguina]